MITSIEMDGILENVSIYIVSLDSSSVHGDKDTYIYGCWTPIIHIPFLMKFIRLSSSISG